MSAAGLELLVASGVDRVIACGGAGNLEGGRALGHVVVPTAAVRDEGASFHYLAPSRTVDRVTRRGCGGHRGVRVRRGAVSRPG